MKRNILLFVIIQIFSLNLVFTQNVPQVKVALDKEKIRVADMFSYIIEVKLSSRGQVELPKFQDRLGGFNVVSLDTKKKKLFSQATHIQKCLLQTYEAGEYLIPSLTVKYRWSDKDVWQEIKTKELKVTVESFLSQQKKVTDIEDIEGPVSLTSKRIIFIVSGVVLLVFMFGLVILRRKLRKNKKLEQTENLPTPDQIAYRALKILKERDYVRSGKIKEFYFELSQIIRHYLEDRFLVRAPEMTTEEFMDHLRALEELKGYKQVLEDFLAQCDMVKFAKYTPIDAEIKNIFQAAVELIDKTK